MFKRETLGYDKANLGRSLESTSFCFTNDPFKQKEFGKKKSIADFIPSTARGSFADAFQKAKAKKAESKLGV